MKKAFKIIGGVLVGYNGEGGEVKIPNGVKTIGNKAFFCCARLTSIIIPDSVTSIGAYAFYKCARLTSVTIGIGVTSIGGYAFAGCSGLTSITLPNGVTTIGKYAFYGSSVKSVKIPNTVTSIKKGAFYGCYGLTSITIPSSVTSIGRSVFYGCSNLQYNKFDNAYYLGNKRNPYVVLVKAKNTSITSCIIHPKTKAVHSDAFYGCSELTSIVIPDGITIIENEAFYCCAGLTSEIANYKAFAVTKDGKLKCRNKFYAVDKKSMARGHLKPCENGIHYCTNLFDIFNYYSGEYGKDFVIGICDVSDENTGGDNDSKRCARWIKPTKILTRKEVLKLLNNK